MSGQGRSRRRRAEIPATVQRSVRRPVAVWKQYAPAPPPNRTRESPKDVIKEILDAVLDMGGTPGLAVRGSRIEIRSLHGGALELINHLSDARYADLVERAVNTYRAITELRQLYGWVEGDTACLYAAVSPFNRETRSKVFQVEANLRDEFQKTPIFFDVGDTPGGRLPAKAVLLYARERGVGRAPAA